MNYTVGQILYVVLKNDHKVIPAQITEEVTRKTLDGLKIDYRVRMSPTNETVSFEEIDGEVFETPEIAVEVLSDRAKSSILKIVNSAVEKSKAWFAPPNKTVEVFNENSRVEVDSEDEVLSIDTQKLPESSDVYKIKLPDGTYANVKMPNLP